MVPKPYPPPQFPSSGITFTLSDHFTSYFSHCLPCFPSFRTPSSDLDELDFPRDTFDSLLPTSSSEDDVAAWGSDALSLRSQFGASRKSSRESPSAWRSWIWRLVAGRGTPARMSDGRDEDFLQNPITEWDYDDEQAAVPVHEERALDRKARDRTKLDTLQGAFRIDEEDLEDGQEEWGSFLSAPLTRLSPKLDSPSQQSPFLPSSSSPPPITYQPTSSLALPKQKSKSKSKSSRSSSSKSSSSSSSSSSKRSSKHRSTDSVSKGSEGSTAPSTLLESDETEPTGVEIPEPLLKKYQGGRGSD